MTKKLIDYVIEALPDALPSDANDRKTATELIELIRPSLPHGFNEQTVRQYLSNLAGNPVSFVAKYDGGNGYYRKPLAVVVDAEGGPDADPVVQSTPAITGSRDSESNGTEVDGGGRDRQREEKFRSVYLRYLEVVERRYTLQVEHTAGLKRQKGLDKWKYPDVVSVQWQVDADESGRLDKHALDMKKSLGEQPFVITSAELKHTVTMADARMAFFQCLSNSRWAHYAVLAVASSIDDESLADELRRLGAAYGIEVQSYGMDPDKLDALESASGVRGMSDATFERDIAGLISVKTLVPGRLQARLDWGYLQDMRSVSSDFRDLVRWISFCLEHEKAIAFDGAKAAMDVLGD